MILPEKKSRATGEAAGFPVEEIALPSSARLAFLGPISAGLTFRSVIEINSNTCKIDG